MDLESQRGHIAAVVRRLRASRGWTQSHLASQLGLSQSRLSQIERGDGSFTAEQLVAMLGLFNVDIGAFLPRDNGDRPIQNALARFGARHLRQHGEAPVPPDLDAPDKVLVSVLTMPISARFVTALAPMTIWSIAAVHLPWVQDQLVRAGVPNRLPWLADNVREAWRRQVAPRHAEWRRRGQRASITLSVFLDHVQPPGPTAHPDVFPGFTSPIVEGRPWGEGSDVSARWRVLSRLQVEDFESALLRAMEEDADVVR